MKWITVHQLQENLWALDEVEKTTLFLYRGRERALLLDTGFGLENLREIAESLCPGLPLVVVNTHAHGDHASGNNQFDRVYLGAMDEPAGSCLYTDKQRCAENFFQIPMTQGLDLEAWHPGPCPHTLPLYDGDVIDLGGVRLRVLETPGHTVGSICLFDEDNGLLFTGDLVLTWQVWGQLSSSTSLSVYARTLRRLADLAPRVRKVLPAHGRKDNPYGFSPYVLPPEVLTIYAEGTENIVAHAPIGEPFHCFAGDGLCQLFQIGGMVYDPHRVGRYPGEPI